MVGEPVDGYESYEAAIAGHPAKPLADEPAGQFMLYSSGTTGRPKGILRPLTGAKIHEDTGPVGALQKLLWGFDATPCISRLPRCITRHRSDSAPRPRHSAER